MLTAFKNDGVFESNTTLLGAEEEFRTAIIPNCPTSLGRLNLVTVPRETLQIVEFKISRSTGSADKIRESSPQILLYTRLDQPPARAVGATTIRLEWVMLTKTKQPIVETYSIRPIRGKLPGPLPHRENVNSWPEHRAPIPWFWHRPPFRPYRIHGAKRPASRSGRSFPTVLSRGARAVRVWRPPGLRWRSVLHGEPTRSSCAGYNPQNRTPD